MSAPAQSGGADGAGLSGLDPRHVTHGRLVGAVSVAVVAFVLAVAALVVLVAADGLGAGRRALVVGGAVAVIAAAAGLAWWWPAAVHAHAGWRCGDDGLEIRRGVWWRRSIHVPRSRVQHTDVSQGPLERRFGLGTLHVFTAGTEHAQVALAGLALETATAIRDHLLAGTGDDAV